MFQKILCEAIGTFILVFSVGVTQGDPTSVAPALWGAMIATGFISGGQFNPAVSIAVIFHSILMGKHNIFHTVLSSCLYIVVQMSFGLLGAYIAYFVINTGQKDMAFFDVASGYSIGEGFLAEFFFTTVLTGLAIIGGHFTNSNILAGGLVATTVTAGDFSVGSYTGGCFNPAVGFGTNMIYYAIKGDSTHKVWLYILAPSLGGVLGACIATFFIKAKKDTDELRKIYY